MSVGIILKKRFELFFNQVEGTLCGFDPFMNLVLDDSIEFTKQVQILT